MLIMTGILRQSGELKLNDRPFRKLWVEHETPPNGDRPGDLSIHEFLFPSDEVGPLPPHGESISLEVRAYPRGRDIAFQGIAVHSSKGAVPKAATGPQSK